MDGNGAQRIHGYCGLCIARCGSIAVVEDGRFTRLEPDPSHPTGQALCAKGRAAPELVYHPERLTHPLRRTRPKGDRDPGWERISWDEALDLTAAAMRRIAERYGPEAVAFSISSPSTTAIGDSTAVHPAADECVRHAQRGHQPRCLRLGPRVCHPLHLWRRQRRGRQRRRRDAGHRQHRLSDLVGLQSELHPPDPRDRRRRGAEARHAADRRRPAPCRARQQGRSLAAGAARHRRRARPRPRQCDDRARLVRSRLHPRLEQRAVPGARRHRPASDRSRYRAGRRRWSPPRLG